MPQSFVFLGDTVVGKLLSEKLQAAGFVLAPSVETADCVLTYCISGMQLEELYLGSGGIIERATEGCHLVDLSPSTPGFAREIYALARVNELQSVDAPLVVRDFTRNNPFADAESLVVFAGGEDDALDRAEPLLGALASQVQRMGAPGAGQVAKSCATMRQAASLVSLVESHALARRNDIETTEVLDALVAQGIVSAADKALAHDIEHGHFTRGLPSQVLLADLTAILVGAEEGELVLPQVESCQHLLELLVLVGGADLGVSALALAYASDEEGASFGLDWSKADAIYGHAGCDHDHDHDHDHEGDFDYGYDYDEREAYDAGLGGFSAN